MNDIYLAKIVSFDNYSLLFDINNLEPSTEEYRLIKIFDNHRAYDLQNSRRYFLLNLVNEAIVDEDLTRLKPNVKYVHRKIPFMEVYDSVKDYIPNSNIDEFLQNCVRNIEELDAVLSSQSKIIDFELIKRVTKERKI